jgi:TorA maturation chaperone TorD
MQHRLLFAAQLLGAPDATALATLQAMQPTWPQLQPAVLELQGLPLGEWQAEHTRLFISGYPHTACPPFESFYRHGDLHGKAVDELEQLYLHAGLEPVADVSADYLGLMLEYAAYLVNLDTARANEWHQELWQKHLNGWLPRFINDLRQHSFLQLYQLLADELAQCHG